jgi:hypothetical protein
MRRFGIAFAGVFLGFTIAGCGGGIDEGAPKDGPMDPQPQAFKDLMKKSAGEMSNLKKPAKGKTEPAPNPTPAPEKKE